MIGKKNVLTFLVLLFALCVTSTYGIEDARLLRSPDINGNNIVFTYGGDLWTVTTDGGNAIRLTSHPGIESNPYYSPDGKWIAFTGIYDGNTDVYVIPSEGGIPRRLTFHPDFDSATGWSGDGKYVIFSTIRESHNRFLKMFKVPVDGGMPEAMPMPMAWLGSMSPDNKYYAYTSLSNRQSFYTWRRYRGGNAPFIWIFNFADNSVKQIPHPNCNDSFPRWMGKDVFFLSDRDRVMNLYTYNTDSGEVNKITNFTGADIKTFGAGNGRVVIEHEGYLHLVNPETKEIKKLAINIPGDLQTVRPGFKKAGRLIFNAALSPTGKRAVFEARGEIVTVPAEKGDVRNLTNTVDKVERTPAWSPDGEKIAYFGEYNNKYALFITNQTGMEKPEIIEMPEDVYYYQLTWSPDSKKVLYTDHDQNIYYMDLATKKPVKISTDPRLLVAMYAVWSPDSNWIAYTKTGPNELRSVYLYSLKTGTSHQITDAMSDAYSPVFDREGKYLFFAASTNKAFDIAWVDLTALPHEWVSNIYLAVLSADEPSPFKPESDEETKIGDKKDDDKSKDNKKDKDKKKEDKPKETKIDLQGISDRIIAVDVPPRTYAMLESADNGKLLFAEEVRTQLGEMRTRRNFNLHAYDMKKREDETVLTGIDFYVVSADGKKILYNKDQFQWVIADAGAKPEPGKGMLNTEAIEVYTDPAAEWRQILYEAWHINKVYFYDPGMHGQDWPAVWKQYEKYLPYVSHRDDVNYLIAQMIGELCIGHAYVGGGFYPEVDRVPGGLLGADFEIQNGLYKFKKIYAGENWNPELRSPLTEPGIQVNEGDYLLEVNGKPVTDAANIYSFFEKTAGKQVVIKVNSKPEKTGAKTFTVVPIPNERMLRMREWIEENRKKVEKQSGGKVGYVYLPNTAGAGYTFFNRYFFAHIDKQGVVLDERFNGGGFAADYIIDLLNRPFLNYWISRKGLEGWTPHAAIQGPKCMIINEYAGSGGDAMPYYFRKRGIGKLVGKRTWGGLVGITGYPPLMDGGFVTSPSVGFVSEEGEFSVENEGVAPDIEVEYTPALVIQGKDPQLEKAVEVVLDEIKAKPQPKFKHKGYPRGR